MSIYSTSSQTSLAHPKIKMYSVITLVITFVLLTQNILIKDILCYYHKIIILCYYYLIRLYRVKGKKETFRIVDTMS